VGSVDQVLSKIERYQKMGMRSFIFSGYPHLDECKIVGEKVLSQLQTCSLPEVYNRVPTSAPDTPLAAGKRL
jgi:alkanesulfonate monooxygenase